MGRQVIIVDDHLLFAGSLKIMINSFEEYSVSHIFSNGQELVTHLNSNSGRSDIILLDVKMPVMNGVETMEWLRENEPDQKVLALSMEDDEMTVISMLRLGVNGYLLKDMAPKEFHFALDSLMEDGYYHSDIHKKTLEGDKQGKFENFTPKELEFLKLSCTEKSYKQIAEEMGRSYKTIDGYREALFDKLNVKSRSGLIMFALKKKLVSI